MNRSELIAAVASDANLTKKEADSAVGAFIATITNTIASGDRITLPGFGTFKATKKAARNGRNPKTGAVMEIPARVAVKFTAGKALKDAVN